MELGRSPLSVLLVEDDETDALLVVDELKRCGWDVAWERVDTREAMAAALDRASFDLIVSDYHMPLFRAPEALALWKERGLDTPFIVVSGTIGEERAVDVLKRGAGDFFLKDRLSRLCSVVERELREAEGRRSERLFHDLFESAPDATVFIDAAGVIRAASRQAEKLFGYEPQELTGRAAAALLPASREFLESRVPRLVGVGQQSLVALRKDGSTFPIELSLSPLTTEPGSLIAAIRDISERRRLEEHFLQVRKMEAVGRLAAGIAHDFDNILGVILGQSQIMLRATHTGHPLRPRLEQVLSASERAAALTRQLLAFSRKQVSATRVLDLNEVVEGMKSMLGRLLGEDVEPAFRQGTALGRIKADPTQIEQILMNLAVNARDAMPNGGHLLIETSNADMNEDYAGVHHAAIGGRYVCLAVSDSGHGMTKDVQARIFEPFFTTKGPGKGTGLGLATVYGIVKQSEGFVYLYSEPGQGTAFKIYFPRVEEQVAETVLLVEDEASLRDRVAELLVASGYNVLAAEGPSKAIAITNRHQGVIHLLLTDVAMPGMSGRDLAMLVTARRPGMRVLYMSGYTEDAIAHKGVLDAGALLISKPFTQESLARKVREALA